MRTDSALQAFMAKASLYQSYQSYFNTTRKNYSRGVRYPAMVLAECLPQHDPKPWLLPFMGLDQMIRRLTRPACY